MRAIAPTLVSLGSLLTALGCAPAPANLATADAGGPAPDGDASVSPALDSGDDAGEAAAELRTCGAPPFVTLGIVVKAASASGMGTPIEGAKLTIAPLCAHQSQLSAADGTITGRVSKGIPFYARFEAKGYAPTLSSEQKFDADKSPIVVPLPPSIFEVLIPSFTTKTTAVLIALMKGGGSGPCDALDGVSFAVDGHPEAQVTYYTSDAIPAATRAWLQPKQGAQ